MTERIALNHAWEFTEHWEDGFLRGWGVGRRVDLPHTCRETPYDYFDEGEYQMLCGYRRRLSVPERWAGKRVFLCVGAAGHRAEVFVNGEKLGEHRCGYTAFRVELTQALRPGEEALLVLRVDSRETLDQPPFGYVIDYMTYGGLYREVWLEVREQNFIDDVFVKPEVSGAVNSVVTLAGPADADLRLRQRVCAFDDTGTVLTEKRFYADAEKLSLKLTVPEAKKWDVAAPNRYVMRTELLRGETVLDRVDTVFGFRTAEFRKDGFYLNGRKLKLVGLNRHQSYPYIGYAAPASLQRHDADILKYELGCNAVRTSHYPQSQHFIDRCDEIGLLVFTEIPGWQHLGGADWKEQAVRNVEDMVTQYRNHPSIILWGVRINESQDDDELYARTNAVAHKLDPTRPTGGVRYLKKSSLLEDVYTYNDFVHNGKTRGCEKKRDVTSDPEKPYLISEYNGHMYPTKTFDSEAHRLEHALRHANVLDAVAAEEDVAGSFGWCMFDYNTHRDFGSGDRICYHGVMDMFRNPKLAAEVYAARQDAAPVLAVSSSFDIGEHAAGNRGRVFLFTNADEVRMYKNGSYIRSYTHADTPYKNMPRPPIEVDDFVGNQLAENEDFAPLQAEYVKDLLNYAARFGFSHLPPAVMARAAVLMTRYRMTFGDAYALYGKYMNNWGDAATEFRFEAVRNGAPAESVVEAPVTGLRLTASPSHTALTEGATYDMALVRLSMRDQNGNVLPFYHGGVHLAVEGPIAVVGPAEATLRGGLGGAFVRTLGQSGPAALLLRSDQAGEVRVDFTVEA